MWAPGRPSTRLHGEAAAETAPPPPAPWLSLPGRAGQEQAALLLSGEAQLPPSPAHLPLGGTQASPQSASLGPGSEGCLPLQLFHLASGSLPGEPSPK